MEAASIFGDGRPLAGVLTQVTGKTGPSYRVTEMATNTHDFFCIWDEFSLEERQSGLIEDSDHILLIGAQSLTVTPKAGDYVTVQEQRYDVKTVLTERAGGVPLLYRVKVKA